MFTGRVVGPGDPEFLQADTDGAIALAEEEAATCPQCGQLKVHCRNPEHQFAFGVVEEQCHATYAIAAHLAAVNEARDESTRRAIQTYAQLHGKADLFAGLDLAADEPGDNSNQDDEH